MATKTWYVAGLSGGHIIPCLTLAQQQKKDDPLALCFFFSTDTITDQTILSKNSLLDIHITLPLKRVPRSWRQYPRVIMHCIISLIKSFYYLIKHRPTSVVSTGGIVAIPVCIAARILGIPIHLYELNAVPGRTISQLAPYASRIFYCFTATKNYLPYLCAKKIEYPLRQTIQNSTLSTEAARIQLGLAPDKKTICILGGSQGSEFLNNLIKKLIETNALDNTFQFIHQTGTNDQTNWHAFYEKHQASAYVFSFSHDISRCYQAADLIICRAGAGTIFEIKFFNKPCILIPLETKATSHQVDNAYAIANEYPGQFTVIEQERVEKDTGLIKKLIEDIRTPDPLVQEQSLYGENQLT